MSLIALKSGCIEKNILNNRVYSLNRGPSGTKVDLATTLSSHKHQNFTESVDHDVQP